MVDILSTPILVTTILAAVGLGIPVLDALRKERGANNNKIYSMIAFGALVLSIGIVIFRVLSGEVLPAVAFGNEVLTDDMFGSFFAVAFLIVSIVVTASSWTYMKGKSKSCGLLFANIAVKYRNGAHWIFNRSGNVIGCMGVDVYTYLCSGRFCEAGSHFK